MSWWELWHTDAKYKYINFKKENSFLQIYYLVCKKIMPKSLVQPAHQEQSYKTQKGVHLTLFWSSLRVSKHPCGTRQLHYLLLHFPVEILKFSFIASASQLGILKGFHFIHFPTHSPGGTFQPGNDAKKVAGSEEPDGQPWLSSCLLRVIHPLLATSLSSAKGNYINKTLLSDR